MHLSIPGQDNEDRTQFSLTKRQAERIITTSQIPFVVMRPGFVVAPTAYGGSALVRALAALPFDLPAQEAESAFTVTDVPDIACTIAMVARRWHGGERHWNVTWNVMGRDLTTLGEVIDTFRQRLGGPTRRLTLSAWIMGLSARVGDLVVRLGWGSPISSTSLLEMRRGVWGNAEPWIAATGIEPAPLRSILQILPAGVQEKWFARLYLLKPLAISVLAIFWSISGLIALTMAFDAATEILTSHGFSLRTAQAVTVLSSLTDIGIGLAIAIRRTCRAGLLIGIGVSLFYMAGAAVITPEMWIEPLGALVKTVPAIVLMLVTLAILEDR